MEKKLTRNNVSKRLWECLAARKSSNTPLGRVTKLLNCANLVLYCTAAIFAADIYISPTGNDAASGAITAPLATLAAARDKADQLKAGNTPVTVYLRGGTYYMNAPAVFSSVNSGTATAPILYKAYQSEKPVLSGGIKVSSAWTISSGSIMVTTIATGLKVDQLFLNGKRQILARYPNQNLTQRLDGYAADCISATKVAGWANPGEGPGYFRAIHISEWGSNDYIINGKTGTTLNYTWVGDNNRGNQPHPTYRMVENIFEELDAPGEWFYRKSTGQLFFYPPAGTTLSTATIELASQDELLRFVGSSASSATSVKYIQFNGITFTHTFRTLFSKPYEPILQSDWAIARAGTVFMQNAENIRIENCFFDQVGGNGVFMSGYNRSHRIYNNIFIDVGATCVAMVGLTSSVRCPSSWSATPNCTDKTPGPLTNEYPTFVSVDNNIMNHFGRFEKQPAGVDLSMTECDTVRHNTIHDCPRAGINFTDGCWGGSVIEYNWVYNAVLETSDHGPFNAWGRDRIGRFGGPTYAKLDSWKTTIVHNNRFEVKPYFFGIDLDDEASNYYQYNNLLIGGGLKLQGTYYNTYLNNILYNSMVECHGTAANSNHYLARNVLACSAPYSFCCFTGLTSTPNPVPADVHQNTLEMDSNCVWSFGASPNFTNFDDRSAHLFTWANWQAGGNDLHSVVGDPLFNDSNKVWPNGCKGDFSLKAGSPALTLGFKNFPMDSFGVMPVTVIPDAVQKPYSQQNAAAAPVSYFIGPLKNGRILVSHNGQYQVTITNALGRTLQVLFEKGRSWIDLPAKSSFAGIYFVQIRAGSHVETRRFVVN